MQTAARSACTTHRTTVKTVALRDREDGGIRDSGPRAT